MIVRKYQRERKKIKQFEREKVFFCSKEGDFEL
jgi:hypothetical protein